MRKFDMHPDLRAGNRFPDLELPDHRGRPIRLSRLTAPTTYDMMLGFTDGYPLVVIFYRGFF
jgi:hypothetical protein